MTSMSRWLVSLAAFALCVACAQAGGLAADAQLLSSVYGRYEVSTLRKVGGGISTDEQAARWSGMGACISAGLFQIRTTRIPNPWFGVEDVKVPMPDGEVLSPDFTIFYGVMPDRKSVRRLLVFERKSERDPYERLEVLDDGRLLDVYDGRIYLLRKVSSTCTKPGNGS